MNQLPNLNSFPSPSGNFSSFGNFGNFGNVAPPSPAQQRVNQGFDNGSITAGERLLLDRMSNSDRELEQRLEQNGLNPIERGIILARRGRFEAARELFERVDVPSASRNASEAEQMRGLDDVRARRQRGDLASGAQGGTIDQTEFQRLNDFARGTETMRARMREGGYTESERGQIEGRLREYDRLSRLFGETSGRAGKAPVRPDSQRLFEQVRTPNPFSFGTNTSSLEQDHSIARGQGVTERNGSIFSDERLDVRQYHQSRETRPESSQVDQSSRAGSEPFTPRTDLNAFRAQMASIDNDHDGRVTQREIDQALRDPRFRGDAARLLAASKQSFDQLASSEPTASFGTLGGLGTERAISLQEFDPSTRNSETYRQRLRSLNGAEEALAQRGRGSNNGLFGASGQPDPNSIRQGMSADCWFLAPMAGMRPEEIGRMITARDDGQYEVRFPGRSGQPPVVVAPPTDAERYLGVQADGDWANVLERAGEQVARSGGMGPSPERVNGGLNWGHSAEAYRLLTGRDGNMHDMAHDPALQQTSAVVDLIDRNLREGRLVTVYSPADGTLDGLARPVSIGRHVYTVVSYDPTTRMVTLRNPWGQNERADRDGRDDGTFQMPISEFQASFPTMATSDGAPAQADAPAAPPPLPITFPPFQFRPLGPTPQPVPALATN